MAKTAKAEPTLADRFIHSNPAKMLSPVPVKSLRKLQARTRGAEKFVFDEDATRRVGEVLRDVPELLIEQMEFARAPFDVTWIEYSGDIMKSTITGYPIDHNDPTRDIWVGVLVDHNRVNVISLNAWNLRTDQAGETIGVLPFAYHLQTVWPLEDQLRFCEALHTSRAGIDAWFWGSTYNRLHELGRADSIRALRATTMAEMLDRRLLLEGGGIDARTASKLIAASAGDLKNVVALLLMLNQPRATRYVRVPERRGWVAHKPKPFMAYHHVNMTLAPREQIVLLREGLGSGELRRRHRVRGHYCHDETARDYARIAGCIHEWVPCDAEWTPAPGMAIDEREHWRCRVCDGKRWWRESHERGDASKGFVDHTDYRVEP
jgi:hypothetical protein